MRRKLDFYPTPEWATEELLRRVPVGGTMLECCAGQGDMAKVLALSQRGEVFCNDLDEQTMWPNHWDASKREHWLPGYDWVITNPPFNQAALIVPLAYEYARTGIAMLLRLSFLEPVEDRGAWLNAHPPTKMIVLPRISFTGNGKTDSVTCAWMIWQKSTFADRWIMVAKNPRFTQDTGSVSRLPAKLDNESLFQRDQNSV